MDCSVYGNCTLEPICWALRLLICSTTVVVIIQLIFLVILLIMTVRFITGHDLAINLDAFYNSEEFHNIGGVSGIAAGAAIVCLAYLGFDGIATLGEEAINPKKNIPRAIMITCVGLGSMYVIFTYLLSGRVAYGME